MRVEGFFFVFWRLFFGLVCKGIRAFVLRFFLDLVSGSFGMSVLPGIEVLRACFFGGVVLGFSWDVELAFRFLRDPNLISTCSVLYTKQISLQIRRSTPDEICLASAEAGMGLAFLLMKAYAKSRVAKPEHSPNANPKPQTPDPKPETPNPKPQTPNPKPEKPETPNPKPQTLNPVFQR